MVCRTTRFSEQFGDAGAPKPGTLQSPPLYVKRTLRGGQTVRHPGSVIVRHISRVPSPDALEARARARPTSDIPGPLSAFSLSSFLHSQQRAFLHDFFVIRGAAARLTRLTTRFPHAQVLGDVDQNSEVIAGGDVFVWGSLRGDVVAGSKGDQRAKVFRWTSGRAPL